MIKIIIFYFIMLLFCKTEMAYAKKVKIPKYKLVDEFEKIAKKNTKKTKGDLKSMLSFRSTDFEGQYYIGGKTQKHFEKIVHKMLENLKKARPEVLINNELEEEIGIYVIYSPTLNAHSTRNNNIFLTSQWIKVAETEAEVATVVAHELAHLILKHPDTNVDRFLQSAALKKFTKVASTITFLSGLDVNTANDKLNVKSTKSGNKDLATALLVGKMMVSAKKNLINPKISRKNESQADFFAVDLIYLNEYPAIAAEDMFKILQGAEESNKEQVELSEVYLKKVQPLMKQWIISEIGKNSKKDIIKSVLSTFLIETSSKVAEKFTNWFAEKKRGHLRSEKRQEKVAEYIKMYYASDEGPPSEINTEFEDIQSEIEKIDEIFELVSNADKLIDEGKLREAESLIKKVHRDTKSDAEHPVNQMKWIIWAKLRIAQRSYKDAIENICKYTWGIEVKNCPSIELSEISKDNKKIIPLDSFAFLAEAYIHVDKYENARSIINNGYEYYNDESPFQIHNVIIGCKEKNYFQFDQALENCKKNDKLETSMHCQTIEKQLDLLVKTENEKNNDIFTKVKAQDLSWWNACNNVPLPFSSVTKNSKAINKKVIELIKKMKR